MLTYFLLSLLFSSTSESVSVFVGRETVANLDTLAESDLVNFLGMVATAESPESPLLVAEFSCCNIRKEFNFSTSPIFISQLLTLPSHLVTRDEL